MQKQRQQPTGNQTLFSIGKIGLVGALAITLAGCVAYVEESPRAAYVAPPHRHPVPPPPPTPPPAVVQYQYQAPPPAAPPPPVVVSVTAPAAEFEVAIRAESDFYEPLAAQGEWVVVASHGRCWRPARVEAGWRPYCNGHWRWTEAGWYWVSDEPWAWATYHYGRWDLTAQFGWVWVPKTEWAPAWVSWREGAGYVGWAPLPPSARIAVGVHEAAPAPRFVFVEERRLAEPVRPTTVIVNNTTVINQTVNLTKVKVVNKTVIHEGPPRETVERASGRSIQPAAFRELRHREEAPVVERRKNARARGEQNAQPPARVEPAPQTVVVPHQPPPRPNQPESPRHTPPPAPGHGRSEVNAPQPPAKPEPPVTARPVRVEKNPEPAPATVRPEARPETKPAAPVRETRPVRKPVDALKQPAPAGEIKTPEARQLKPLAKPARAEPEKPARLERKPAARPEAVQPAAINQSAPQPGGKQTEQQLKPDREKTSANERTERNARQKAEKKKSGQPETNLPPAATPPAR